MNNYVGGAIWIGIVADFLWHIPLAAGPA
jgi:hypothetical protein